MKAQRQVLWISVLLVIGVLAMSGAAQAQLGPGPFAAFPSQSATDGRFLGFGCAGLATFEQNVQIALSAPASTTTFDLNIFDGDTGALDGLARRHWDLGTRQLKFSLYADPLRIGSTLPTDLIGQWFGNASNPTSGPLWTSSAATMPDNDWWAVTVTNAPIAQAPSGNYFYNLVIDTDGACGIGEQLESSLKIAASNPMNFRTPRFGLVAGLRQTANDVPIIYPGSTTAAPVTGSFLTAPTTYDGTFEFYFTLPGGETELRLFDGDFDYGTGTVVGNPSGIPLDPCFDQDDPDTDSLYLGFPFLTTGANPEGVQGSGSPPDDNFRDIFRRGELGDPGHIGCVRYEVTDPEGNIYFNDNPSGSFEWEQFLIASSTSLFQGDADWIYGGNTLPGGIWKVTIIGLDLANLNFWYADTCGTRPERDPIPGEDPDDVPRVPACADESKYLLGDFVWADTANTGVLDPGEAGIPGVLMELVRPLDGAVIGTAVTGDSSSPNWAACLANNTGTDTNGLYCFGMDSSGIYEVRVAASNFGPGGALEGQASTTGGDSLTRTLLLNNVLTYDFGYAAAANGSLGDRVWLDDDGDGLQDAGEEGINGVTVELLSSGGTVLATQLTSGDGDYTFTNLAAGTYSVRVVAATLPAGLAQTYDLDGLGSANVASATLAAGENRTDVDFGYRGTASVGDRVWNDADGDGLQDAGEAGINGVTVELLDSGGAVIASQATSGDGNYTFDNLAAGNYSVRVVAATLPAGSTQTFDFDGVGSANVAAFTLAGGQNRTDIDFGYRGTASLGDRVWLDFDADGLQDAGENGINGVTVELLDGGGNVIASQVTAGDGNYTFSNLAAGSYSVRVVSATLPAGLAQTYDLDGIGTANVAAATLAAGQNRTDVDFGYRGTGSLGDRVWLDFDADGAQDAGENGINGVTVELLNSGGTVVATQTTAGDGTYTFSNLPAGSYSVRVVSATLPAGLAQTYDLDGIGSANVAAATLAAGQNRTDVDFGYKGTASVGDRVWNDKDGDGVQGVGEVGLNGVTVELLNSGGTVVASQVTSGDGNYNFTNLPADSYTIRVVTATLPAASSQTYDLDGIATANVATFTLAGGQNRTDVDYGYRGTASVGDRVWIDTDGDGVQDAGETGINGVTVELLNSGGTVVGSQVTAGDGNYSFPNLAAGNYSVRVVAATLPAGLAQTFDLDGVATANVALFALAAGQTKTDVDFGYRGTASAGDRLWIDADGDGVQDAGETGINGVTVELLNSGGTVIASRVTSGDGNYSFTNLVAANYSVRVVTSTLPAGLAQTFDLDGVGTAHIASFALAAAQNRTDVDFGYRGTASVGDRVWLDTDGDGVQDAGETGINGVSVELLNSGGTVVATQTTAGDGTYTFPNLVAGNYSVRVVTATLPAGLAQTFDLDGVGTAHIASFALAAAQNRTDVDFGYRGTASVGDRVWLDTDGDGVQDAGETGINGATVELLNSGGTVVASQVTSGDGNYSFTNLAAGNYSVRVVASTLPAGLVQTYDLDGFATANIASFALSGGQNRTDVDFGYRGTASAGDRVWTDTDGDGVQDAGETGINGVTVELLNSGGTVIASRVTAGDGNYSFTNLVAGNYSVRVVTSTLPAGLAQTFDLDGVGTANIASFALAAAQNRTDVDFGYRNTASVGDRVWLDTDGDGVQDAGETGINGVTVELLNSGGTVVASQTTAGDGNYSFTNLAAGNYSVRVVTSTLPAGLAQTFDLDGVGTANIASFALAAGQNRTDVDFGYRGTASVGDRVWTDADGDGVQDAGETGINGVTVELLNSGGTVIASRVTAGDGNYSFTNLLAGTYSVRVVAGTLPAGVAQTYDLDGVATANVASFALAAAQNRTDVDFGYRQPPAGSIGDRVWNDTDGDGVQDAGEAGINGVTVRLLDAANNVIATQVTAGGGNYTFGSLMAGNYTVVVDSTTLPAGFGPTYDLDGAATPHRAAVTLASGQVRTDADFGYRSADTETCAQGAYANPTYSGATGGHSFWLPNIGTDFLFAPATGSFVQHADGTARLTGIIRRTSNPSQAFVVDVTFSGFTMTAPANSPKKEMLASAYSENGGPINTATFKYYPVYTGKLTGIETFAGAVINITAAGPAFQLGNGANNKNILYGASGWFLWTVASQPTSGPSISQTTGQGDMNLDLGNCASCVNEANNDPAVQTAAANHALWLPGIGTDFQFAPNDGTFVRNADGTARLTGTVYSVSNPTRGLQVDLTFSGYTSTAPSGSPKKELAASAYVENGGAINPATWNYYTSFTGALTGVSAYAGASITLNKTGPAFQVGVGANNKNRNFGGSGWFLWTVSSQPTSGASLTASGQGDLNFDMFDCPPVSYGSIGNRVWNDADGDGVQDSGETGINGVTVRLVDTLHAVTVATTTTSGDGGYTFANVIAGSYRVEVVSTTLPLGYNPTFDLDGVASAHTASFSLTAGQNRTDVDFGYKAPSACTAGNVKDNFSTASFSNNDGTLSWAGAWIESDTAGTGVSGGNVTVGNPYSGFLLLHDSPDTGTQPSAARQVNLSSFSSATLSFTFHTTSGVDSDDAVVIEVSNNGGSTYTVLETLTGITGAVTATRSYNISSYVASNTRIRFRVSQNYGVSDEYFKVDTVKIDGSCSPPPPPCTAGYFKDHFSTASFSNNDGSLSWAGAWVESDSAGTGVGSGNVTVGTPYSGYLHLHDSPDTGTQPSAARQADLTDFASATLQLAFHTTSGVDTDDAVVVEVSNNGGSTYTALETFTGISGSTTGTRSYNISSSIASNTRVRFRVSKNYGVSDEYFKVDWVRIDGACAP